MRRVLIPVDGSEYSDRAIAYLIGQAKDRQPLEIHLLNVQEPVRVWQVRKFLLPEEIERFQRARSEHALQAARELLEQAGLTGIPHGLVGPIPETIARTAKDRDCDTIIMGTAGISAFRRILFRSIAARVVRCSEVPVTLVSSPEAHRPAFRNHAIPRLT